MLVGKMLANQFIKAQKWMANHFEIEPNSAWIRWTDLVKSAQGLVLLDLNPTYLMQNILDNQLKLIREGMGFTRYAHLYLPNRSKRLAERVFGKGMIPERFAAGFGGEYGQQTVDAINAAQKAKKAGLPEAIGGGIEAARKFSPIRKVAGGVESGGRLNGNMIEYMKSWHSMWKEGKGFPKLTPDIGRLLPEGFEQGMYDLFRSKLNQDELYELPSSCTKANLSRALR